VLFTNYSTMTVKVSTSSFGSITPSTWAYPYEHLGYQLYSSRQQLDLFFPDGNFTFVFGNDFPTTNVVLSLTSQVIPPFPRVSNYEELQSVDVAAPVTISWDPIEGATDGDQIELRIANPSGVAYHTGTVLGMADTVVGTATSLTVPAGKLKVGLNYIAHLSYYKVASRGTNVVPGFAAVLARTDFSIMTVGASIPAIVSVVPAPGSVEVPQNAPAILVFDRPMKTSGWSVLITGLKGSFNCSWIDERTFSVSPSPTWTGAGKLYLNSMGLSFSDTNGCFVLPETLVTSFQTSSTSLPSTPAPPRLSWVPGPGPARIQVDGEAYRRYQLETSTNLIDWQITDSAYSGTTNFLMRDSSEQGDKRFYRVGVRPQ
jgi:hypothetical protein